MNPMLILQIIAMVLQLIINGMSESTAIARASNRFGIAEDIIRRML